MAEPLTEPPADEGNDQEVAVEDTAVGEDDIADAPEDEHEEEDADAD